jgi:hypothetical protein
VERRTWPSPAAVRACSAAPRAPLLAQDPVVASDGHSYERTAIEDYIKRKQAARQPALSPLTRETLKRDVLIPNIALRKRIESHAADELRVAEAAAEAARAAGRVEGRAAGDASAEAAAAAARAEGEAAGRAAAEAARAEGHAEGAAAERKRQAEAAAASSDQGSAAEGSAAEGSAPKRACRR